jgi:endonuclease YncB( thermonuclease family)
VQTTDRYGRVVAEVFTGINVNLALVEVGQAFACRHPRWHHVRRPAVSLQ